MCVCEKEKKKLMRRNFLIYYSVCFGNDRLFCSIHHANKSLLFSESSEAAGARRLAKERESFLKEVNAPAPAPRVKRAPQMPKPVVIPPDVANVPRLRRRALASALHQLL